jgi:lambda repressor-like predicted transcriptional regulator
VKGTMNFFDGIPPQLRASFELERTESDIWFQSTCTADRTLKDFEASLLGHIVYVFAAYAQVLCDHAFPDSANLPASELRARADAFLASLIEQEYELKHPRSGTMNSASLKKLNMAEFLRVIHASDEWSRFLQNVLTLAEWQSSGDDEHSNSRVAAVMPMLDELGWSPEKLANQAGVDEKTCRNYLNGTTKRLNASSRQNLANALGIPVDKLPA